jgi:hypothetical protein
LRREKVPPAFDAISPLASVINDLPIRNLAVYPYLTTVQGNRFRFCDGDPSAVQDNLRVLFETRLGHGPSAPSWGSDPHGLGS